MGGGVKRRIPELGGERERGGKRIPAEEGGGEKERGEGERGGEG